MSELTPLETWWKAVADGDARRVHQLLSSDPLLSKAVGPYDKTALHVAAEKNHSEVARLVLDAGADLEPETCWGMTPIQWAANMGSNAVADLLLERGSALNMWSAAGLGMLDAVRSFWIGPRALRPGAAQPRYRQEENGQWVKLPPPVDYDTIVSDSFYIACRNGRLPVARFLIDQGADINFRGFFGATGLHWAAINGHYDTVRFLIEHGADVRLEDFEFHARPIGWAREHRHDRIIDLLTRHGG